MLALADAGSPGSALAVYEMDGWGQYDLCESEESLLLIVGLSAPHLLVPLALADARLVVRRASLDVQHDGLDGRSGFVAVAVHCAREH